MLNVVSDINSLCQSAEFDDLVKHTKRFNMFSMMRIEANELIHSNIIAYFLDPQAEHGLESIFLKQFLSEIHPPFESKSATLGFKAKIRREFANMDIVIDLPDHKFAIAIENKIRQFEREEQIKDYQNILPELFKGYRYYSVIFLTPDGRKPVTADFSHKQTAVFIMSYRTILRMVETVKQNVVGSSVRSFIDQFVHHLKEDIVGDSEVKRLCLEIYRKYPNAYRRMIDNLPSLNDIKDQYFARIKGKYPVVVTWEYPVRNSHKTELSARNPEWALEGAEIKLFLDEHDMSIKIFAALGKPTAIKYADSIKKVFGIYPYEVASGWYWWCFSSHRVNEIDAKDTFDDITADISFAKFEEIYRDIDDALKSFPNHA